ncbi:hypothetical protein [Maridesulfovibrio zosterae]|uniref:hypothetical protein n=1 Tax=Maridesulfovibrio zosterae TaxID=82171 RepID=UPI000486FD00|nr:hypothetical protein [Maridesulfovibrio zosterae]
MLDTGQDQNLIAPRDHTVLQPRRHLLLFGEEEAVEDISAQAVNPVLVTLSLLHQSQNLPLSQNILNLQNQPLFRDQDIVNLKRVEFHTRPVAQACIPLELQM